MTTKIGTPMSRRRIKPMNISSEVILAVPPGGFG
jgi:hypothetical protein